MAVSRSIKSVIKMRNKFSSAENRLRKTGKFMTKSGTMKRVAAAGVVTGGYVAVNSNISNPMENKDFARDTLLTMISVPAILSLGVFASGRKIIAKANRINKSKQHLTKIITRKPVKKNNAAIGFIRKFGRIIPIRRKNAI